VGGTGLCTGTVVGPKAVLTAQHCYCDHVDKKAWVTNFFDDSAPGYEIAEGHPMRQCGDPQSTAADVALLITRTPFDASVTPAVFASKDMIDHARLVRAVGFGKTDRGMLGQKMMVDIAVVSPSCSGSPGQGATDAGRYGCYAAFELVAADPVLLKDTCNGDSGGPVFVRDGSGQEYLAAATSRAIKSKPTDPPCGLGGIYERVDGTVTTWLQSQGVQVAIAR
jgi:secreted trypsin-like serine protease